MVFLHERQRVVPTDERGAPFGLASLRQRDVPRDGEEPGREAARAVEAFDPPVEADQHLLRDVVRRVLVAGETDGPRAHTRLHARDEPLEGGGFPRPDLVDERRQVAVVAPDHR